MNTIEEQLLLIDLQKDLKRLEYRKLHLLHLGFLQIEVENKLSKITGKKNEGKLPKM